MLKEILFLIVVFVSNIIQAITGFAGTMLAMPASMILIGVNEAKSILNVMGIISCLILTIKNYKSINRKEFIKITIFMFIGMIFGISLFKIAPINILLKIYAVIIILIAVKNMFVKNKIALPNFIMILIILTAGIIHGMFVSGGSLLVIYAVSVLEDKKEFRATLSPVWVLLNSYLMYDHIKMGFFTANVIKLILISIIPLIASMFLGNILHDKMNQNAFLKLTYILLLISGLLLIF